MAMDWDMIRRGGAQGTRPATSTAETRRTLEDAFLRLAAQGSWGSSHEGLVGERLPVADDLDGDRVSLSSSRPARRANGAPRASRWLEAVAEEPTRGMDPVPLVDDRHRHPVLPGAGPGADVAGRPLAGPAGRGRGPLADGRAPRTWPPRHQTSTRASIIPGDEWRELMEYIKAHFGYVNLAGDRSSSPRSGGGRRR